MPASASTGALPIEQYTKTCDASSTMQPRPPSLKQFSSHLRQVVWPRNFKLKKLKKYDDKENPENWITLYEIVVRSTAGDEHVMANYFPVVLDQAGHQWLLGLPEDSFDC